MANYKSYLLLDKDDITHVCGVMSGKEILKEMTRTQLTSCLNNGTLFRGKYILIENEFRDNEEDFKDIKFDETDKKYFYASRDGEVFTINKRTGKKYMLTRYMHHGFLTVKANEKEYRIKNLIAQIFLGARKRDIVELKNNDPYDCSVGNLIVIPLDDYMSKKRLKQASKIGLYENGKLVRKFKNVNECAKELHYSKRSIHAIIAKEYKTQAYDLRFI